jgi:hypothetical protein
MEDFDMGRFGRLYVLGCVLLGFVGFAVAQTSITNPASVEVINRAAKVQYQLSVAIATGTPSAISFTDRKGGALSSTRDGAWIEIAGIPYWVKSAKSLSLPADLDGASGWTQYDGAPLFVYAIYNAATGVNLCIGDEPNRTTKGAVVAPNYGYMLCGGTTATSSPVRMIGKVTMNTTPNTVTGYTEAGIENGVWVFPYKFAGQASSAAGGATTSYTVAGLTGSNKCMTQNVEQGVGTVLKAVPTSDAIIVTYAVTPVGTPTTTINYICW